jgi:hypothetical protein
VNGRCAPVSDCPPCRAVLNALNPGISAADSHADFTPHVAQNNSLKTKTGEPQTTRFFRKLLKDSADTIAECTLLIKVTFGNMPF